MHFEESGLLALTICENGIPISTPSRYASLYYPRAYSMNSWLAVPLERVEVAARKEVPRSQAHWRLKGLQVLNLVFGAEERALDLANRFKCPYPVGFAQERAEQFERAHLATRRRFIFGESLDVPRPSLPLVISRDLNHLSDHIAASITHPH
ncbi:hypothetical protein BGY98DRAFT_1093062 [Russula aff. rugulosa BPL654]|nr:hypothetical protein BGY98DRAFT_1093062 [Russula aff. rugulosa BPL654]